MSRLDLKQKPQKRKKYAFTGTDFVHSSPVRSPSRAELESLAFVLEVSPDRHTQDVVKESLDTFTQMQDLRCVSMYVTYTFPADLDPALREYSSWLVHINHQIEKQERKKCYANAAATVHGFRTGCLARTN